MLPTKHLANNELIWPESQCELCGSGNGANWQCQCQCHFHSQVQQPMCVSDKVGTGTCHHRHCQLLPVCTLCQWSMMPVPMPNIQCQVSQSTYVPWPGWNPSLVLWLQQQSSSVHSVSVAMIPSASVGASTQFQVKFGISGDASFSQCALCASGHGANI